MRSYEQSQMRLGMNRIDLLLIHDLDFWFHTIEAKVAAHLSQLFTSGWRALDELRSHGLVRGLGAGINELGMMPRFLDALGLDFFLVALRYTLMEQDVLQEEFPYCERAGVGVVVGGVYNSGITATGPIAGAKYNYPDATPEVMERVGGCKRCARPMALPLAAAALQFPLAHPIVASVIPGAISPDQVRQNVESFRRSDPGVALVGLEGRRPDLEGRAHAGLKERGFVAPIVGFRLPLMIAFVRQSLFRAAGAEDPREPTLVG